MQFQGILWFFSQCFLWHGVLKFNHIRLFEVIYYGKFYHFFYPGYWQILESTSSKFWNQPMSKQPPFRKKDKKSCYKVTQRKSSAIYGIFKVCSVSISFQVYKIELEVFSGWTWIYNMTIWLWNNESLRLGWTSYSN